MNAFRMPVGGGAAGAMAQPLADSIRAFGKMGLSNAEAQAKGALLGAQTYGAEQQGNLNKVKAEDVARILGLRDNADYQAELNAIQPGSGTIFKGGGTADNMADSMLKLQKAGFFNQAADAIPASSTGADRANWYASLGKGEAYTPHRAVGNSGYAIDQGTGAISEANPALAAIFGDEAAANVALKNSQRGEVDRKSGAPIGNPFEVSRNGVPTLVQRYPDGSIRPVEGYSPKSNDDFAIQTNPDGTVNVTRGAKTPKLTEGQSKDLVYLERGEVAFRNMEALDKVLASPTQRSAASTPLIGNALVSDDFQKAQQAGREFLAAILRKDTGAAITEQEMVIYGQTYLPQPFDSDAVLKQKSNARRVALDAIRKGLAAIGDTATTQADLRAADDIDDSDGGNDAAIAELRRRAANNPELAAKLAEMGY